MHTLLIDVGGTHVDSYIFDDTLLRSDFKARTSVTEISDLDSFLSGLCKARIDSVSDIIIGIPGDVQSDDLRTFCPPLGSYLNTTLLRNYATVVNDTLIHPYLHYNSLRHIKHTSVLLTIGTSIGMTLVDPIFFINRSPFANKSYEFAHQPSLCYNDILLNYFQQNTGISTPLNKSVYSVGGIVALAGGPTKVRDDEIILAGYRAFTPEVIGFYEKERLGEMFTVSLRNEVYGFLESSKLNYDSTIYLAGGLLSSPLGSIFRTLCHKQGIVCV